MSMRKDREITIIRESTTKSSRPAGRLSVSLTEALLGDSLDPLLSLREEYRLDEDREKLDGHTKKTTRYLDQHPKFRELAKSIPSGTDRLINLNIDGVPAKQTFAAVNKKGIPRAYTDRGEAKDWIDDDRTDASKQEPVIEIVPTTTAPGAESGENPYEDAEGAAEADRQQTRRGLDAAQAGEDEEEPDPGESSDEKLKALLPEFDKISKDDSLSYEQKLDKWLETYNKAIDLSEYDDKEDLKIGASGIINNFKEFKKNIFSTIKDPGGYFLKNVRLIKDFSDTESPMSVAAKTSLMDIVYKAASEAGGDGDPGPQDDDRPERDTDVDTTEYGDGDPGEDPQQGGESGGAGRPAGEPEGGDVVGEPPGGQGGGENPPPPPADDIESVKNYIDQVAQDREIVDLSERKLPMHKRSLAELLYSTKLA